MNLIKCQNSWSNFRIKLDLKDLNKKQIPKPLKPKATLTFTLNQ